MALTLGDDGWFRRDPNTDRHLNLRRGPDGAEDLTFLAGIDFLQCGKTAVEAKPNARALVDRIAGSKPLEVSSPAEVKVGSRTATELRLAGTGPAVPEEDFGRSNEFGCVLSMGDVPFPEDSGWVMLMPDTALQLILLDIDGTTVVIRAGADHARDDHYRIVRELLAASSLG